MLGARVQGVPQAEASGQISFRQAYPPPALQPPWSPTESSERLRLPPLVGLVWIPGLFGRSSGGPMLLLFFRERKVCRKKGGPRIF